jgi:peptidoglycan/xylan/chitin deacetylase (PgdA/CDA1 family)
VETGFTMKFGLAQQSVRSSQNPLPRMELPSCTHHCSNAHISLEFAEEVESPVRARIEYSFRVFAAIFGYKVVQPKSHRSQICFTYGGKPSSEPGFRTVHLPCRYDDQHRRPSGAKLSWRRYANEDFPLFYGVDDVTDNPDWLAEVFEWLSSSHERDIRNRDSEGRVPYADTVFARQEISPRKPYATMLMAWLDNYIRGNKIEALPRAPSPMPGIEHIVVCSHDIDFYFTNGRSALRRLSKNLLISLSLYRSWSYFFANARMILDLFTGRRIGDYVPALLTALKKYDITSTLFVVAHRAHRRDPNYQLDDLAAPLSIAHEKGFPVALHGSYESIVERKTLLSEVKHLHEVLGKRPVGSRQHWLRFDTHEHLFEAIKTAALLYDSSLGFSEAPGFRNGASFAFPPYDFTNEKPHDFLEIPLVLMDGNVEAAARRRGESAQEIADSVLRESRAWSWGGIALLWHNPMESLSVPPEINRVFWSCAGAQQEHQEKWISAEEFLKLCLGRYQNAGLMKVPIDA